MGAVLSPPNGTNIRHVYASGDIYVGDFKDGQRHGNGVYTSVQGHRYEGAWVDDKRHGIGTQTFVAQKKGKSKDGKDDDKDNSKVEWAGTYKGEWANNMKHGKGVFHYRQGDKYEGDWMNGKKHGNGVYTYAIGDRYEGEFQDNYMHGKGILYTADGSRKAGNWWKDDLHGEVIVTNKDGSVHRELYEWGEKKAGGGGSSGKIQKTAPSPSLPPTDKTTQVAKTVPKADDGERATTPTPESQSSTSHVSESNEVSISVS